MVRDRCLFVPMVRDRWLFLPMVRDHGVSLLSVTDHPVSFCVTTWLRFSLLLIRYSSLLTARDLPVGDQPDALHCAARGDGCALVGQIQGNGVTAGKSREFHE